MNTATRTITLRSPDDCHLHLRDADMLKRVVNHSAREFARAVVMPNLKTPVTTVGLARDYRKRIQAAVDAHYSFDPLMTLYLTDNTQAKDITEAAACDWLVGAKLYPAGATTNSSSGVTSVVGLMPILEKMAETGMVLQVHGEVTDPHIDIFDREAVFIEQVLKPIVHELPELRIVLEHITTQHGVEFVQSSGDNIAGTLTPQHLLFNRNEIFRGGIRPHNYCLPVLKRETHRAALAKAATSGSPKFFLGTDSAPHTQDAKETACGCAGCYSAHAAMPMYTRLFEQYEALDKLEQFSSIAGARFYGLPLNQGRITLAKENWRVPDSYPVSSGKTLIPLFAGEQMDWKVA
ncbi:MAG: dihydroorotase [Proteobacteria bacterium]|nr:dihydroorotase [Pseudomonadota bacterium]